ncbi:MAG: bifunctional oligoribonuclease/PAP phosphatase NrnA [Spirochaetia bacterium]|jgi:phosphoesterase RecJ-like protein|nr:bifunctional oligoribonuclease/PAP phosphatase NrnA [Spirochaetia bacterium]
MNNFNVPIDLQQILKERDSFLLIGHKNPDGDCLSSQLALGSFLKRQGKRTCLLSPGPFDRSEIVHQEKYFHAHIPLDWKDINPLVIVLDCSTIDRIGYLADEIKGMDIAVIDHHDSGMSFGDIQFIRPEAPSVTFLIHKIIESFNTVPNPYEAELLLFGIATDTGFFRHLESGSQELFQSVAKLTECGASPKDAYTQMYGGRTLKSKQLAGRLLSRITSKLEGKLILTFETEEDLLEFGTDNRDSDVFYGQVQGIQDVEVIILIRFESKSEISVGLRSKHYADVGAVAKTFGGGGHKKAAGFTWNGSSDEITEKLLEIFKEIL